MNTWDIYVNARAWQDASVANPASDELSGMLSTTAVGLRETVLDQGSVDVLVAARRVDYEAGRAIIDAADQPVWLRCPTRNG